MIFAKNMTRDIEKMSLKALMDTRTCSVPVR